MGINETYIKSSSDRNSMTQTWAPWGVPVTLTHQLWNSTACRMFADTGCREQCQNRLPWGPVSSSITNQITQCYYIYYSYVFSAATYQWHHSAPRLKYGTEVGFCEVLVFNITYDKNNERVCLLMRAYFPFLSHVLCSSYRYTIFLSTASIPPHSSFYLCSSSSSSSIL